MTMIPLPLASSPNKTMILQVASGTIDLEAGGDGVYLQFNCDCADALPYCKARCCSINGILLNDAEARSGLFEASGDPPELKRCADGYCCYNDRGSRSCTVYEQRPVTCRDFHCSRGPLMRGWRLELSRLSGSE
jgi:hypothetical protein